MESLNGRSKAEKKPIGIEYYFGSQKVSRLTYGESMKSTQGTNI